MEFKDEDDINKNNGVFIEINEEIIKMRLKKIII